jgi:MSHA biogenesis protein MshJ
VRKLWARVADRIDAASLRERAVIFAAAALLVVAFAETVFLQPEFTGQRRLASDLAQRQGELKGLQQEIAKLVQDRDADPDKALRERVSQLRAKVEQAERRVAAEQARFTRPEQMKRVVEELLARNRRIRLVDLKTLQTQSIADAREQVAAAQKPGPVASAERQIFRHGIEITVTGGYLDILAYVSELERLPTQLYWSSIEMAVSQYPAVTAKLKIYTLSLDKAWMNV